MSAAEFVEIRKSIIKRVRKHMSWSNAKANHWFVLPNPLLGGVSPQYMVESGRTEKLWRFIDEQTDGEKP